MIVCQCNLLSQGEIEAAVEKLLDEDPWQLIVPSKVYHFMRIRGRCCGCFPDVVKIIGEVSERARNNRDSQLAAACGTSAD